MSTVVRVPARRRPAKFERGDHVKVGDVGGVHSGARGVVVAVLFDDIDEVYPHGRVRVRYAAEDRELLMDEGYVRAVALDGVWHRPESLTKL